MNKSIRSFWLVAALVLGAGLSSLSIADLAPGFNAALQSNARPADEKMRDAARKPGEVLNFVGIEAGMVCLAARSRCPEAIILVIYSVW